MTIDLYVLGKFTTKVSSIELNSGIDKYHRNQVPSTALTSDDLDTQMAPVQIMLFVAALFIYGRTFYTCS